jgi:hypothetical protein
VTADSDWYANEDGCDRWLLGHICRARPSHDGTWKWTAGSSAVRPSERGGTDFLDRRSGREGFASADDAMEDCDRVINEKGYLKDVKLVRS